MEKDEQYFETLDKRTKEYKEWKASQKPEGLGDVIEKITEATGIKAAVKWLAGDDCGCDERKEKMNKLFPSAYKADCLQEDEYKWLDNWFKQDKGVMKPTEQKDMLVIYNRVFSARQQFTNCSSCLRDIMNRMRKVYEAYDS